MGSGGGRLNRGALSGIPPLRRLFAAHSPESTDPAGRPDRAANPRIRLPSAPIRPRRPARALTNRARREGGRSSTNAGTNSPPNWLLKRVTSFNAASVRSSPRYPRSSNRSMIFQRRNGLAPTA